MSLSKYEIFLLQKDVYWFVSTGKQGDIYKAVLFQPLQELHRFNLAMGDINLETGEMEFDEMSGNGDARKVFATVGGIVKGYTENYPEREILIVGNTDAKRRSYSLMTSWYLDEIQSDFEVWGALKDEPFERFEKGKLYYSILAKRK